MGFLIGGCDPQWLGDATAHDSVGCYVFHAGFSSVIEALANDCQLVMLPIRGDQLVRGDLKAGVEVDRRDEDGYFSKDDIKNAVQSVMVGIDNEPAKSIRNNQKKWKEFLQNADIQKKFIDDLVQELRDMIECRPLREVSAKVLACYSHFSCFSIRNFLLKMPLFNYVKFHKSS